MAKKNQPARLIVASSDHDPDMLYATRMFVPDPFIFLEENGRRTIVLSDLEIDRGRKQAQADEILAYSEFEREVQGNEKRAPAFEKVLSHFLRKRGVRSAVVPSNFPLGYAEELGRSDISLQTTNGLFWPERESKTAEELRLMRRALSITEKGLARATEVLAACKARRNKRLDWFGRVLTSEILRAEIDYAVLRAGGLPANTIVAGGDQACDPHERGSGPLFVNSLIILDIFPRDAQSGYYGDMTRTVLRGRASDAQRQLWEAVRDGQALALKKMKPGTDGLALHNEVKQFFTEKGFPTEVRDGRQVGFFHGTGHGLGLEIHEFPRFQKTVFKPGQVLTVEPGLYYPGLGGARIEDVAVVTESGNRIISRFEKRLEI
ncbi:MAG: Xaa-Pro peptidase family protein [Verrucomicrobiota bacterium]|jgi:Xaa-Pro aminopeptidase|nr:aminopeptidase P family protein [Chthoniobacterales bacterium]MBA3762728.1 aminopeptidase P family protein [Chthoniobacterales bacterium]MDQ3313072.1 Xaa-Pro peptidase family protein [Verrucomicrobiota bacterium]